MAPEQIQTCIETCNLCAEAGEAYLRSLASEKTSGGPDATLALLQDAVAMCRITACSLDRVSAGAKICSEACAQLCDLSAQACAAEEGEEAARCERVFRHTARECRQLATGLPAGSYLV